MMWKSLPVFLLAVPSLAWVTNSPQIFATRKSATFNFGQQCISPTTSATANPTATTTSLLMATNGGDNDNNKNNDDTTTTNNAEMGLNELQTLLRDAAQSQDFIEAGRLSDVLATRLYGDMTAVDEDTRRFRRRKMSWRGLGAAPWLVDRLDNINYTFPTTIQINAMEAVNSMLNTTSEMVESTSLEERMGVDNANMGIVISGNTGSGKTLAYLIPLLSTLSDSLFTRQRLRVGWEESVGDTVGDLMERVAVVTSPVVRSRARKQIRQKGAIATGASLATLGKSDKEDIKSPLALIVCPGRELGVQIAMLLYSLVGGNVKKEATEFSGKANMFKYKGPKGIRIGCVLDEEEANFGLKLQTDVAITTPEFLGKLISDGDIIPSKLRVVIYDEADLALEMSKIKDLGRLFDDSSNNEEDEKSEARENPRLTFLVGASVTESLGNLAVSAHVLPEDRSYIASATSFAPLSDHNADAGTDTGAAIVGKQTNSASLKDLDVCLDAGLRHERVIVEKQDASGLLVLARLLRNELQTFDEKAKLNPKLQRPRVVVFFPDEAQAKAAIAPLRDAMWGEHKLCVLLPKTGFNPMTMMEQFRDGETSVMLATPNSVRGLDFPSVSHVYTLYLPMDDPREYVHLAGRVGRIGQMGSVAGGGGRVISILKAGEEAEQMDTLAKTLGFDFIDSPSTVDDGIVRTEDGSIDVEGTDVEKLRRMLEDTMSLVNLADDPSTIDVDASSATISDDDDDDDEEDDDDEDDDDEEDDTVEDSYQ